MVLLQLHCFSWALNGHRSDTWTFSCSSGVVYKLNSCSFCSVENYFSYFSGKLSLSLLQMHTLCLLAQLLYCYMSFTNPPYFYKFPSWISAPSSLSSEIDHILVPRLQSLYWGMRTFTGPDISTPITWYFITVVCLSAWPLRDGCLTHLLWTEAPIGMMV